MSDDPLHGVRHSAGKSTHRWLTLLATPIGFDNTVGHASKGIFVGLSAALACSALTFLGWAATGMLQSIGPCGFGEMPPLWDRWLVVVPLVSMPVGIWAGLLGYARAKRSAALRSSSSSAA